MEIILEIFSTRELSLLLWITLTVSVILFIKDVRESLGGVPKLLFGSQVGIILLMLTVYVVAILFVLYKFGTWDFTLLKDTIFWFASVALVLFFTINKAKHTHFFKDIVKESFKWTIALEFIVNFYTFSLPTEIILMPIIIFLSLVLTVARTDKKYEQVNKILTNVFAIIGLTFIVIVAYKTFMHYHEVLTLHTLFSFLLAPILTVFLIPFLYLLVVFMNYEELFIRIDSMTNDKGKRRLIKKEIFLLANLNLNRQTAISKKMNKFDSYHSGNLKSYLRTLTGQSANH